jgi:hypothetical protein
MANKGTIPWNKGITVETSEGVKKYTDSKKGIPNEKTRHRHEANRKARLGDDYLLIDKPDS